MNSSDFRRMAREALNGKWGKAAVFTLVYMLITCGFAILAETIPLLPIAYFIITPVITFGFIKELILLKQGQNVECIDFFKLGFKEFSNVWKIYGNVLLKQIGPIVLIALSFIVLVVGVVISSVAGVFSSYATLPNDFINTLEYSNEQENILLDFDYNDFDLRNDSARGGITDPVPPTKIVKNDLIFIIATGVFFILFLIAMIWMIPIAYKYMFAYNELAYEPELTAKEIVNKSGKLMVGNRFKAFKLAFSFIGWVLLAMLLLGIPMLWILPYMQISLILFYEHLRDNDYAQQP